MSKASYQYHGLRNLPENPPSARFKGEKVLKVRGDLCYAIFYSTSSAISSVLITSSLPSSFIPSSIMARQKGHPTATLETFSATISFMFLGLGLAVNSLTSLETGGFVQRHEYFMLQKPPEARLTIHNKRPCLRFHEISVRIKTFLITL
jgi:hypothetical protein